MDKKRPHGDLSKGDASREEQPRESAGADEAHNRLFWLQPNQCVTKEQYRITIHDKSAMIE
jgi:hypothetical protein